MANLSSIITPSGVATGTQGALADTAVQPNDNPTFTGVTVNGNVVTTGTVDGVDVAQAIPATLGTAAQVLTVNTGATAGEWADVATPATPGFVIVGTDNLAGGLTTMSNRTSAVDNFAALDRAMEDLTSGRDNIAIGWLAGQAITAGLYNVALGRAALADVTTGDDNVAIGRSAGNRLRGGNNVAIGFDAVSGATFVDYNIGIGADALSSTALSGDNNICMGQNTGRNISSGERNVMLGYEAGASTVGGVSTTSGDNQIIIGYRAGASTVSVDHEITLGNSSITALRCQVTTITSLSDERDKTDIEPLNAGLEFVEALNPVSFTWDMRDGGKVGEADTGFIAQELQAAQNETGVTIPHLVFDANPDKLEAGYGKLIPVLVQAIKDLSEKVKTLEDKMEVK